MDARVTPLHSTASLSSQAVLQMGVSRQTRSYAQNSIGTQATAARDYAMREKSNLSILAYGFSFCENVFHFLE